MLSAPSMVARPASEQGLAPSRLSQELRPDEVDGTTEALDRSRKRFSMMKLRNYSESHLSDKAKEAAQRSELERPPLPMLSSRENVPAIVKTAPTMELGEQEMNQERRVRPSLFKRSTSRSRNSERKEPRKSVEHPRVEKVKGSSLKWRKMQGRSTGLEDLARLSSIHAQQNNNQAAPPSYGEETGSALALPVRDPRSSDARESDESNGSSDIYGQTTTTTHTVQTHTTFFRLPRRNKNRDSLFPLPAKPLQPNELQTPIEEPGTPRGSTSAQSTKSVQSPDSRSPPPFSLLQRRHTETSPIKRRDNRPRPPLPSSASALARGGLAFAEPSMSLDRNGSHRSRGSSTSSPLQPPMRLGMRDRASTASSFGQQSHDMDTPPPMTASGRNSSSTTGRSSLGGFLTLSRFRNGSQPESPRHSSPGTRSKANSFAMSREVVLVVPQREEGDTPSRYLERLEAAVARSTIAGILSKSADPFAQAVLRSYTRRFPFFGEPIDMSLRKFLLEAELPKETQQVDRVIQAFADRYHECNPGIFKSPDQAYIIAFSLMMLHTDAFNKNNKRKMQRHDYIKNTSGQQVAEEVLGCFYDNICYTPFVHYDEDVDINGERVMPFKPKKSKLKGAMPENGIAGKKPSGPVDPYNLLVDQKLDMLRPAVKESIAFDDPYNYRSPSQAEFDMQYLQHAFTHTGILQIISARSRPTAYEGQLTANGLHPPDTSAGIVDLKVTKVGTLWRKSIKKKKTRSPWQEWGAILTGSQLYLFKNAHWAKGLMHQFSSAQRPGHPRTPVIFKPPLSDFKPDALIKTDNAAALVDQTYNRHKHAFTFFRTEENEEILLADNEAELNDWLSLINYAAAFRAAGVRIRGMVGGNEEDLRRRESSVVDASPPVRPVLSANGSEVMVMRGALSPQLQRQVMAARCQIMVQKIAEAEQEIQEANRKLEDCLRDARHLLLLAPIAPKTREDVLHAAAKADALIKWLRRDVWRIRTYRDILAMDVKLDGISADELQNLTLKQVDALEASKRVREGSPHRGNGAAAAATVAVAARSPPQSPISPAQSRRSDRPSTAGTAVSFGGFMGNDVFATPSEGGLDSPKHGEAFRLPPLQLNVQPPPSSDGEHRGSITSTLLSVSSPGRGTLSHASSTSSVRPLERQLSEQLSIAASLQQEVVTPTQSITGDRTAEMLARVTTDDDARVASRPTNLDGTATQTPESRAKSVRRSLQKTLREAQQNAGSAHRHRKNKESDGTIRSGGADGLASAAAAADEVPEGTPQLQREKGRFILHGKQASVIQFGADWPNERMKQRRERWRTEGSTEGEDEVKDETTPRAAGAGSRRGSEHVVSPLTFASTTQREFNFASVFSGQESEHSTSSAAAAASRDFKKDMQDAHAFASAHSTPSVSPLGEGEVFTTPGATMEEEEEGGQGFFDPGRWDGGAKRQTIIGPTPPHRAAFSARRGVDEEEGSDLEDYSLGPRENRRMGGGRAGSGTGTRTGDLTPIRSLQQQKEPRLDRVGNGESGKAARFLGEEDVSPTSVGAERGEGAGYGGGGGEEDVEDDSMVERVIGDEELRRITEASTAGV
ncbi:hypothetical protein LTR62_002832 [Meristemomyces frigidus]|uniref:Uncharacterized protein n=1 Tax=Meristemomyces frigidus TaxID=1508187 RepID=A0AAN7TJM7_9PEZI|nr:hypothetical protein LTR62_002832 [Meristemomyces frigidus]